MTTFEIGHKVKLATHPELVFDVVKINQDQSYELQIRLSETKILSYDNISAEMLKKIDQSEN